MKAEEAATIPVLDSFDRGDATPLDGMWAGPISFISGNQMRLASNTARALAAGSSGASAYTGRKFSNQSVLRVQYKGTAANNFHDFWVGWSPNPLAANMDGILFGLSPSSGGGLCSINSYVLRRGVADNLSPVAAGAPALVSGDTLFFVMEDNIRVYVQAGGVGALTLLWTFTLFSPTAPGFGVGVGGLQHILGVGSTVADDIILDNYGGADINYAGVPETVASWDPLLLDDVFGGGPRPPAATPTNRGDGSESWRGGIYD